MKVHRKTQTWFNPKTARNGYIVKLEVESMGRIDLASSMANKSGESPQLYHMQLQSYVRELMRLLLLGYTVDIPCIGAIVPKVASRQVEYQDAKKLTKASISKITFKVNACKELKDQLRHELEGIEVR